MSFLRVDCKGSMLEEPSVTVEMEAVTDPRHPVPIEPSSNCLKCSTEMEARCLRYENEDHDNCVDELVKDALFTARVYRKERDAMRDWIERVNRCVRSCGTEDELALAMRTLVHEPQVAGWLKEGK